MLLAIMFILKITGTTNYNLLLINILNEQYQKILWLAFFLSFATKIPMIPMHIWLPEAHVEAPTSGSVILAGLLLKLGSYGFIRFSLPLFSYGTLYYTPLVYTLAIFGVLYASFTAIRQTDLKRIIAYASIAHMNIILIGLFSLTIQGVEGSILQMLSHGIVSSALFLAIGVLYDRFHTRLLKDYSGIIITMPIFSIIFLFFILANIAFPITSSFIGEFLIFVGIFKVNIFVTILAAISIVLGAIYSIWLYNRIVYTNLKVTNYISDITKREFFIFFPLIILTLIMGIYPLIFWDSISISIFSLLEQINTVLPENY
jgi:proton-translocating NADH-quinone oxidoreductase chain M